MATDKTFVINGEDDNNLYLLNTKTMERKTIDKNTDSQIAELAKKRYERLGTGTGVPPTRLDFLRDTTDYATEVDNINAPKEAKQPNRLPLSIEEARNTSTKASNMVPPKVSLVPNKDPLPSLAPSPVAASSSASRPSIGLGGIGSQLDSLSNKMGKDAAEAQRRSDEALKQEQDAIDKQEQAGRLAAASEAGIMREKNLQLQKDQIDITNREREKDLMLRNAEWEIRKSSEDIKNKKIEAFKNKSSGQIIGLAIAAALVELGNGIRGAGAGKGMEMLNSFMDRDIAEQQSELDQMKDAVNTKYSLLGQMKERFKDQRIAEDATRALMYKQIDTRLDEMAANNKNLMSSAQYQQLKAQLAQKQADAFGSAMQGVNTQALSILNSKASVAANQEQMSLQRAQIEAQRAQGQNLKERAENDISVPGMRPTGEKIPSRKEAEEASKARTTVLNVLDKIESLNEHINEYGSEWTTILSAGAYKTEASLVGAAKARDLHLDLKNIKELGVLAGPDLDMLEALVDTNPNQFWTTDYKAKLESLKTGTLKGWQRKSRQYGYEDIELTPVSSEKPF